MRVENGRLRSTIGQFPCGKVPAPVLSVRRHDRQNLCFTTFVSCGYRMASKQISGCSAQGTLAVGSNHRRVPHLYKRYRLVSSAFRAPRSARNETEQWVKTGNPLARAAETTDLPN